jgi:hypothetical protein
MTTSALPDRLIQHVKIKVTSDWISCFFILREAGAISGIVFSFCRFCDLWLPKEDSWGEGVSAFQVLKSG